jgi:hypothetical protein
MVLGGLGAGSLTALRLGRKLQSSRKARHLLRRCGVPLPGLTACRPMTRAGRNRSGQAASMLTKLFSHARPAGTGLLGA